jgi:hypothetical protein
LHQWIRFYVQWGVAAALVIGGLEGAVMIKGEKRLAEVAARDVAAAADGGGAAMTVTWSQEYLALYNRMAVWGGALVALVVVTIFVMAVQA